MLSDVTTSNLVAVRAFLEAHLPTSVFLLYCLDRFGPTMGDHRDSGHYQCVEEAGAIVAVASATRRGHLLIETGSRTDVGHLLLAGLADRLRAIDGVVGEWNAAQSVWPALRARDELTVVLETRNVAYGMDVSDWAGSLANPPGVARLVTVEDFDLWYPLFHALEEQEGAEMHGTREEVRQRFAHTPWRWWGIFDGAALAAVGCLDLVVAGTAHVGGMYVHPDHRRKGFARSVLTALIRDGQGHQRVTRLVLFTREDNASARRLYEGMGFTAVGQFGFLLGRLDRE